MSCQICLVLEDQPFTRMAGVKCDISHQDRAPAGPACTEVRPDDAPYAPFSGLNLKS
jgi:hypothetical protein